MVTASWMVTPADAGITTTITEAASTRVSARRVRFVDCRVL
jgi:hypothetical protein